MDSFPGLEFESDILSDIDFGLGSGGMGGMNGSGLDSPGTLPFNVGTPPGVASLGTGVFPGLHNSANNNGGQSNNSSAQTNSSGGNSDLNRDDGGFHDDDGMFFGSDIGKDDDKASAKPPSSHQHHGNNAPPATNSLGRGNNSNPSSHMNHDKPNNQGPASSSLHHSNHMGGRKDSVSDQNGSRMQHNGGGPPSSNPSNPNNAPKGPPSRLSESNTELLSSLLLPDSSGPPMNMGNPNSRPHINQGGGPPSHVGMSNHYGQPAPPSSLNYGQVPPQQRNNMNMYGGGGYNQPPPPAQPRAPYQQQQQPPPQTLQRTTSMSGGQLMRQTSGVNPFPTNYDEELAKLKSMLSAQPDLIPPPQEILRATQQLCMANMQRLQQQHSAAHPNSYMQQHMQNNPLHMQPGSSQQMPPGYNVPPPSARNNNPPGGHLNMDPHARQPPPGGLSMPSVPPSGGPPSSRQGLSPSSTAISSSSNPQQQAAAASNNQIVSQGNKTANVWQSESDVPLRRKMIAKIVSLLQQRKPDAPTEWIRRLPDMARRLEDSLYRTATGREVYGNFNTLKTRLQHLAVTMGARAAKGNDPNSPNESSATPSGAPAIMGSQQQQITGPPGSSSGGGPSPGADALGDMDSADFLDLGMGDDGTDMADDPIDALMRGSTGSLSDNKKAPTPSASPKPDPAKAPKRPLTQQDSHATKRAKASAAKRTPRTNSASPPVAKTPPPPSSSSSTSNKQPLPSAKTPPPPPAPPVNK
ncbi:hypothetical protein DYB36_006934 [Aphanomyces astaci]|uniref:Mediator complex subunit 15 KIX domain-containing protein n=1 Tax=Aphanomyces astaci TaxID=112090 RepID=A0A397AG77_APHAT|nr:hypothetical protein DYB36_006934 [Aphanomyces astaci]